MPERGNIHDIIRLKKTAECRHCDLHNFDLREAIAVARKNNPTKRIIIGYSDLRNSSFENADLSNAVIARSDLSGANFKNANLERAILNESKIDGTNFSFIKGSNATFDKVTIISKGAIFTGAVLIDAQVRAAKLSRNNHYSTFENANLYNADFWSSILHPKSFNGARNIYYASFEQTALESICNIKALWHAWKNKLFS
jgi:uncharacterized protein YjbI with pentapeptide repeats